jgi:hypothetical protein
MATPPNLIERYVGDDWTVAPIALTAGGAPFDATGSVVSAQVYVAYQAAPVLVLIEGDGLTMAADRTTAVVTDLWVPKAVTSTVPPQDRRVTTYLTRIDIVVTDSRGRSRTWLIIPVLPLDRRSDLPA